MQSNQNEQSAIANVKPLVSAVTLAYGARTESAQMLFSVSMALETLPAVTADNSTFQWSKYNDLIESESGNTIAKKTIQNGATLARKLQEKFGVKLAECGEHSETSVSMFADFLRDVIANTTYTLKRDDLIAMCKGESSEADKRKHAAEQAAATRAALEDAKRKAAEEAAAKKAAPAADAPAADAPAPAPAPLADVVQAQADKAAAEKEEEDKRQQQAQAAAERNKAIADEARIATLALEAERAKLAQAQADAEKAKRQAEEYVVRVTLNDDGSPNIVVALNPNAAFLTSVAGQLLDMAKLLKQAQATAMGSAITSARSKRDRQSKVVNG